MLSRVSKKQGEDRKLMEQYKGLAMLITVEVSNEAVSCTSVVRKRFLFRTPAKPWSEFVLVFRCCLPRRMWDLVDI